MRLNLTEYLESEGRKAEITVTYEKPSLEILPEAKELAGTFSMNLSIRNEEKGCVLLQGSGTLICKDVCDRCLTALDTEVPIQIEERITEGEIRGEAGDEAEERSYLDGYELDTDRLIEVYAAGAYPMKILCKEDCLGICSKCGHNLNEGDCGCDRFVPDPRMAAIGEIFAKGK